MDLALPEKIDRGQWLELMGRGKAVDPDENITACMDECEKILLEVAAPKGIYVFSDDMDYEGKAIARHLEGCDSTVVMGITLGRAVDEKLTRLSVSNMAMGVIYDAGAGVLAEAVCGAFEEQIREKVESAGRFMTSRFSPGYGDLPLSTQRRVIGMLDAERKIGLTLNDSDLMIPLKSITAICGLADTPVTGCLATCD